MEECKTWMRAGGGSQQRPVSLRQRKSKGMSARKDGSLLGCASGEWLGTGLESRGCAGFVSSRLKLWLSLLLPPLT